MEKIFKHGITGNCTWSLDGTVLTIRGNGAMADYNDFEYPAPWGTEITEVIIEPGVTYIGDSSFEDCPDLAQITLPNTLTSIGDFSFSWCHSLTSVTLPKSIKTISPTSFYQCSSLIEIVMSH